MGSHGTPHRDALHTPDVRASSVYKTEDTHREAPADAQPQQFSYSASSMDAQALGSIGQTAEMYTQPKAHNGKMNRKEKRALKAEQKAQKRELAARQKPHARNPSP